VGGSTVSPSRAAVAKKVPYATWPSVRPNRIPSTPWNLEIQPLHFHNDHRGGPSLVPTRQATTLTLALTSVAVVATVALWIFPGYLATSCPLRFTADGRSYCAESVTLIQCAPGCALTGTPSLPFYGFGFQLRLSAGPAAAFVGGGITEPSSISYQVFMLGDPVGPSSVNWTSPDHLVVIEWHAPFVTADGDGAYTANVTCGVSYP